jgi:hypothetical protein
MIQEVERSAWIQKFQCRKSLKDNIPSNGVLKQDFDLQIEG